MIDKSIYILFYNVTKIFEEVNKWSLTPKSKRIVLDTKIDKALVIFRHRYNQIQYRDMLATTKDALEINRRKEGEIVEENIGFDETDIREDKKLGYLWDSVHQDKIICVDDKIQKEVCKGTVTWKFEEN